MTTSVKNIIIGFGKAGKTLAGYLGSQGEETILIEKSKAMYGGTCLRFLLKSGCDGYTLDCHS